MSACPFQMCNRSTDQYWYAMPMFASNFVVNGCKLSLVVTRDTDAAKMTTETDNADTQIISAGER